MIYIVYKVNRTDIVGPDAHCYIGMCVNCWMGGTWKALSSTVNMAENLYDSAVMSICLFFFQNNIFGMNLQNTKELHITSDRCESPDLKGTELNAHCRRKWYLSFKAKTLKWTDLH